MRRRSRPATSANARGGSTAGTTTRPHCLTASRAIRSQRAWRAAAPVAGRATTRAVSMGMIRATPSSVAFWTSQLMRSPFRIAWASVIAHGDSRAGSGRASMAPHAPAASSATSRTV